MTDAAHTRSYPATGDEPMNISERIRCDLALQDAGYKSSLDRSDIEELLEAYDRLAIPAVAQGSVNADLLQACKGAAEWLSGWASAEPYLSRLESAIAKAEASPAPSSWQWFSMAPRDGDLISAWHKVWKCPISVRYVVSNAPCKWIEASMTTQWPEEAFSHWQPLPTGPAVTSTEGQTHG